MVISKYSKQRIIFYWFKGLKPASVTLKLKEVGIYVSRVSVWKFIKQYELYIKLFRGHQGLDVIAKSQMRYYV